MAHITSGSKNINLPFSVWNAGIISVSGSLTKGSTLTISGYDFGNGADLNQCFYDSCDRSGVRGVNDPEVGSYQEAGLYYQSGARDGGNCARVFEYDDTKTNDLNRVISSVSLPNVKRVYFSYWYQHVAGTYWPSTGVTGVDNYTGAPSSMKIAWLQYTEGGTYSANRNDISLPNFSGDGAGFSVFGNNSGDPDGGGTAGSIDSSAWAFGEWIKFTGFFDVDVTDPTADGKAYIEVHRPTAVGQKYWSYEFDYGMRVNDPVVPYVWDYLPFGTYYRSAATEASSTDDMNHVIDDIYVSWGDAAPARIELGDNADYDSCTERTNCYPSGDNWWSDSQIQVVVEQGGLDLSGDVWLFLTHENNKRRMSWKVN